MTNNKKISITGHTSGLGKALFDHFTQKNFAIEGYSRQNGYDISYPETQKRLIEKVSSSEFFINNAHSTWAQVELLYSLFEKWKDQPKHIINISSNSGDGIKNYIHPYAIHKNSLDKASEQLNNIPDAKCRVTNVRPAWIATDRIKNIAINDNMLNPKDVVSIIEWLILLPSNLHIPLLSLRARD